MEHRTFDRLVRAFGEGMSRRGMLRRVAASSLGGAAVVPAAALAQNTQRNQSGRCRSAGKTCDGGQECCAGLICTPLGAGGFRCMPAGQPGASASVSTSMGPGGITSDVCAGDCAPQPAAQPAGAVLAPGGIGMTPSYVIDVTCNYESAAFQTICVALAQGPAGAPPVRSITLPTAAVCGVVVDERSKPARFEEVIVTNPGGGGSGQASAGTGGSASADASGGAVTIGDVEGGETTISVDASGGNASADASGGDNNVAIAGGGGNVTRELRQVEPSSLTVVLEGRVEPAQPTTYWLETEAGLFPATGPALNRVAAAPEGTGALTVEAMACDVAGPQAGFDWFGQCTTPAAPTEFTLTAVDGGGGAQQQRSNERGQAHFTGLAPGRYRLDPVGATWCYATSDAVDEAGQVVVEADRASHVWIFTCAGGS